MKDFPKTSPSLVKTFNAHSLADDFYAHLIDWPQNIIYASENKIYTTNLSQNTLLGTLSAQTNCLRTSPNKIDLCCGLANGNLCFIDLETSKQVFYKLSNSRIGSIAWLDSNVLFCGSRDRYLRCIDLRTSNFSESLFHKQEVCGLSLNLDRRFLSTGGNDNYLGIMDLRNLNTPLHFVRAHNAAVKGLAWSQRQNSVLVSGGGTADKCLKMWDINKHSLHSMKRELDEKEESCKKSRTETSVAEVISHINYISKQAKFDSIHLPSSEDAKKFVEKNEGSLTESRSNLLSVPSGQAKMFSDRSRNSEIQSHGKSDSNNPCNKRDIVFQHQIHDRDHVCSSRFDITKKIPLSEVTNASANPLQINNPQLQVGNQMERHHDSQILRAESGSSYHGTFSHSNDNEHHFRNFHSSIAESTGLCRNFGNNSNFSLCYGQKDSLKTSRTFFPLSDQFQNFCSSIHSTDSLGFPSPEVHQFMSSQNEISSEISPEYDTHADTRRQNVPHSDLRHLNATMKTSHLIMNSEKKPIQNDYDARNRTLLFRNNVLSDRFTPKKVIPSFKRPYPFLELISNPKKPTPLVHKTHVGAQICNLFWTQSDTIISTQGYSNHDVRLYDNTLKLKDILYGHKGRVIHFAMEKNEKRFVTGGTDGKMYIWSVENDDNTNRYR